MAAFIHMHATRGPMAGMHGLELAVQDIDSPCQTGPQQSVCSPRGVWLRVSEAAHVGAGSGTIRPAGPSPTRVSPSGWGPFPRAVPAVQHTIVTTVGIV